MVVSLFNLRNTVEVRLLMGPFNISLDWRMIYAGIAMGALVQNDAHEDRTWDQLAIAAFNLAEAMVEESKKK